MKALPSLKCSTSGSRTRGAGAAKHARLSLAQRDALPGEAVEDGAGEPASLVVERGKTGFRRAATDILRLAIARPFDQLALQCLEASPADCRPRLCRLALGQDSAQCEHRTAGGEFQLG